MKSLRTQKGITLVALIITIVVLLILAAVAIGAVKDSNIIGHSQNAAVSFNQAKANEMDALAKYEQEINKYVPKTGNVEYYIMGSLENPGYAMIQRLDFNNYKATTYNCTNGTYTTQSQGDIPFEEGEKIEDDSIEITVSGEANPVKMKGAYQFIVNGYVSGYIKDKILYCLGGDGDEFYRFDLIEDANAIAEIEAGIASVK